jgi:hypothetical protein
VFSIRRISSSLAAKSKAALSADAGLGFDRSDPSANHAAFQRLEYAFQLRRVFNDHRP